MTNRTIVMITWSPNEYRLNILKRSYESLIVNTRQPYHLVIVDNGPAEQTNWLREREENFVLITPPVNLGVGKARNLGAKHAVGEFITFVDNDLLYFDGWLDKAITCLQEFPGEPLIACPRKSSPMKHRKYTMPQRGSYDVYSRASGQCLVLRMEDLDRIGPWSHRSTPGGQFCKQARARGYFFIRHPDWKMFHLAKKASYNFRHHLNGDGIWVNPREAKQESINV